MGSGMSLYSGSEYLEPTRTNEQHPFYLDSDWIDGAVHYNGDWYRNVSLLYDITSDKLVTEYYFNGNPMLLVKEKLDQFSLGQRYFKKFFKEDFKNSLPATGFYEVLYNGQTMLIARREKKMQDRIEGMKVQIDFEEKYRYFILRNGEFLPIRSKKSMYKLLEDKKQELKQRVREEKLNFKLNREQSFSRMAALYDSLTPLAR
jgi:hypothetical protein